MQYRLLMCKGPRGNAPFAQALIKALQVITSGRRPLYCIASVSARLLLQRTPPAGTAQAL